MKNSSTLCLQVPKSSMKNSSDCIPTLTTKRITFVHNHACRSIPNICCH